VTLNTIRATIMHERSLFLASLEIPDPAARAAYLDRACAGDKSLRDRLELLLAEHARPGSLLAHPPQLGVTLDQQPLTERPGTIIGPYKLMEQIGEGGMGLVFVAEQQQPVRRRVALKIIKPGMDSAQVIARFEAERQALAMMDHQNIAKVHDAGTTDTGRPYFVMELVHGVPITDYCDANQLNPRQRLELFVPVCQAIQHAHQKGIIHRDIKPSNILVTMYDDRPVPKVIDFGVAKAVEQRLTEKTLYTQFGTLVGTFEYMSPEQAEMNALGVDTRSDVYSLGVLLYELLTGSTPLERGRLREAGYGEIVRLIKEEEPQRPSVRLSTSGALAKVAAARKTDPAKLSKLVQGELDWVVMRCLEKDRTRRYDAASSLARDIQRYLADEPVEACPPSARYRLRKFARKHQKLLATAAAFAVLLLLGVAGSSWQAVRATQAEGMAVENQRQANANAAQARDKEKEANQERDQVKTLNDQLREANQKLRETQAQLEQTLYASRTNLAQYAWEAGDIKRVLALLDLQRPNMGETDLRNFEWDYLYRLCHSELLRLKHSWPVHYAAYSPDGKRLATVSFDTSLLKPVADVKVWDAQTGKELLSFKGKGVYCVAFNSDGKRLATPWEGVVKEWDTETGKELRAFQEPAGALFCLAYSPDGKRLAAGLTGSRCAVWDTESGKEVFTLQGHTKAVLRVAFSPDSKRLATASNDKTVKVWDLENGKELRTLEGHTARITSAAFSPDGKQLATSSYDKTVKVWDAETGKELRALHGPTDNAPESIALTLDIVGDMAYSPDGKKLASGWGDGSVRLWDAQTGKPLFVIRGHSSPIISLAFRPDGKHLASASYDDETVRVWDAQTGQEPLTLKLDSSSSFSSSGAVITSDAKGVAVAEAWGTSIPFGKINKNKGRTIKIWDIQTGKELKTLKDDSLGIGHLAFRPDGKQMAATSMVSGPKDRLDNVKVWDLETDKELMSFEGGPALFTLAFSADSKLLAGAGMFREPGKEGATAKVKVKVWDAQTGKELHVFEGASSAIFSPDGKRLAGAGFFGESGKGRTGKVKVWDAQTGKELFAVEGSGPIFSADGKRLATVPGWGGPLSVKVWDAQTGQEIRSFNVRSEVGRSAFSPDGKRLAIASRLVIANGEVTVWDVETGRELILKEYTSRMLAVAFSPDGKRLVTASSKSIKVWDAQTGQELLTFRAHNEVYRSVAFTPDGHRLVIGAEDGTVKIYDATPLPDKP
jgi:WD40 repeat protein/serine/threonine protein kinase